MAGLPDEADFDADLAAAMASESGRRFLTEFASRNRHADTLMLVGAIARVEAAIRGEPPPQAADVSARDLIALAAAIDGIGVALAAAETQAADAFAALERIQDIAFVLHERPVEPTLCDALDAAVREISNALSQADRAAQNRRKTAELVSALANRVRRMIGGSGPNAASDEITAIQPSASADRQGLVADDDRPSAEAVVLAAAGEAQTPSAVAASWTATLPEPSLVESGPTLLAREAVADATANEPTSNRASASEAILYEAMTIGHSEHVGAPDEVAIEQETTAAASFGEAWPSEGLLPSQAYAAEQVAQPDEAAPEPFAPLPIPSPLAAPATAQVPPPQAAARPLLPSVSLPAAGDPLAAVNALSEEELIALFS